MTEMSQTQTPLEIARRNMVEYQIRCCKVLDSDLLDMLETMPREDYMPQDVRSLAYMEGHVPIACNQETLTPLQEASIIQALKLQGHEKVLEIGAGTGYLTTLLAMGCAEITSCELHGELASLATNNLQAHGVANAKVIHINAMDEAAMANHAEITGNYDIIVIGASLQEVPAHIRALLAKNSQMIAFIGENPVVTLTHYQQQNPAIIEDGLFETLLQEMEALPEKRQFVF